MTPFVCILWGVSGFVISLIVVALIVEFTSRPPKDDQTEHERWCDCLCDQCEPPLSAHIDGCQDDAP